MKVRVDKWLQVARVFKTRTRATKECAAGRVQVNGETAKPHRGLEIGDMVEIRFGDWTRVVEVVELAAKPLPKAQAALLYRDHSAPRPSPKADLSRHGEHRDAGSGRPTKRDRRLIDRWRKG